eukprot:sb/3463371/
MVMLRNKQLDRGLVWCITVCSIDLDVDLLYQENSTIGQKITLTEKIVAVLPKMKCPHELQPHQIQGLDCVKIYPVVQWLVKKAMDRREEMSHTIRQFAEMQFSKDYILPSEREHRDNVAAAQPCLERFIKNTLPGRLYKRPRNVRKLDIKLQAQSTLLEYGDASSTLIVGGEEKEEGEEENQDERRMEELLENVKANPVARTIGGAPTISVAHGCNKRGDFVTKLVTHQYLSPSPIGQLLQERSSELVEATTQYEEEQATLNEDEKLDTKQVDLLPLRVQSSLPTPPHQGATRRAMLVTAHERTVRGLNSQISQIKGRLTEHTETMTTMREKYREISEKMEGLSEKIELGSSKVAALEKQNKEILKISDGERIELASLMSEYDIAIKTKESFTTECKEKAKEYRETITEVQGRIESLEEDKRCQQVRDQHEKDRAKLAKVRLQAAKKNYAISALRRQIEAIPSRVELIQYQKRFEELHIQTGQVHTEAKQFYALFNNLSDTKSYLEKHLVRLNSINENFLRSMSDIETGYIFLQQFEQIVEGAKQSRGESYVEPNEIQTKRFFFPCYVNNKSLHDVKCR